MATLAPKSKLLNLEKPGDSNGSDFEVAPGHLQEIEVDIAQATQETEEYDEDSEHSPYPEGTLTH
jgi:hypothetical protein